jgi:hypothetical protein
MPSVRPEFSIHRTRRIAAAELVRAFNAQHNDCRAVLMGDVLVIRPLAGRLPFLDQRSTVDSPITVTGAMAAARRVFSQLDTGLLGPVLNSLGRESDEIPILLDGNGTRTVIEMLNQIALQAPSSAWVVTTRHERGEVQVVSFGFLEGNGSRRTQRVRQP